MRFEPVTGKTSQLSFSVRIVQPRGHWVRDSRLQAYVGCDGSQLIHQRDSAATPILSCNQKSGSQFILIVATPLPRKPLSLYRRLVLPRSATEELALGSVC